MTTKVLSLPPNCGSQAARESCPGDARLPCVPSTMSQSGTWTSPRQRQPTSRMLESISQQGSSGTHLSRNLEPPRWEAWGRCGRCRVRRTANVICACQEEEEEKGKKLERRRSSSEGERPALPSERRDVHVATNHVQSLQVQVDCKRRLCVNGGKKRRRKEGEEGESERPAA